MSDYATLRRVMVDTQVRPSDVTKFPIIQAMLHVPREAFLPNDKAPIAYNSEPIDIAPGRTVLAARTFAKMIDALNVTNDMLVLDIGSGYGYSAAVLARIAEAVVAVEADEDFLSEAQTTLSDQGADNVIAWVRHRRAARGPGRPVEGRRPHRLPFHGRPAWHGADRV